MTGTRQARCLWLAVAKYFWGGPHSFTPCTQGETTPGGSGDTEAETFN
jgi:hypothetical protein